MDGGSAPGPSRNSSPTTCSMTGSAVPARATTKGRSRGWSAICGATSWCRCPSFESFEALNVHLERRCLARMDARLRGHSESIGQRMERDLEALAASAGGGLRRLREAGGPGEFAVTGPVQDQRLLGAGGLRAPRRFGKRLRGPGGHQLRV